MVQKKNYGRVMFVGTVYSLLIYLLISSKEQIEDTFFFMRPNIKKITGSRLNSYSISANKFTRAIKSVLRIYFHIISSIRWKFLKTAELFGQDHLYYVTSLVGDRGMTIIEDGTTNYKKDGLRKSHKKSKFKEFLYGSRVSEPRFGASKRDKKVILTGLGTIPSEIKDKVEIVNLRELWHQKSAEDKEFILSVYGVNPSSLEKLKGKSALLVVQNLECYNVPEDVVVDVYRKMVEGVEPQNLVIKPHPASSIDFSKYFSGSLIFTDKVPMELLTMIGVEFKDAYTISSTAVLSMPKAVNVHFAGTSVHPLILKSQGRIEYSDFVN